MNITIYTLPNCKYCECAKDYLLEKDIEFKEINLKEKEQFEARKYWRSLGFNTAPIIVVRSGDKEQVHAYKDMTGFREFMEKNLCQ